MKKVAWFLVVAIPIVFTIIWIQSDLHFDELIEESNTNLKNIKKVRVGMSVDSMIMIMGDKGSIRPLENKNTSYWFVHFMEDGESTSLRVYVDSTGFVYEIFNPREFYKNMKPNPFKE